MKKISLSQIAQNSTARFRACATLCALIFAATAGSGFAQFSPGPNPIAAGTTNTNTQFITGGSGTNNGTISVSGTNAGIIMSGNSNVVNSGTVLQSISGGKSARGIQSAGTNAILTITNNAGAVIHTGSNDTVAAGTGSTSVLSVTLNNAGLIQSDNGGGQAVNFNKITNGGTNVVINSGTIMAANSDAVRTGLSGTVSNSGLIKSTDSTGGGSDGIDAQQNSGAWILNTGTIEGARHGITGGTNGNITFTMTVTNNTGGTIQGDAGSGINIDGRTAAETVTVTNAAGASIIGSSVTGDGDGVDIDGVVSITNNGVIKSLNSLNDTSEGVTVGGGTIANTGTIEGSTISGSNGTGVGRGMTFAGVDKDASGNPAPAQGIYAAVQVTNSGLIKGDSDTGITVTGSTTAFKVTINNQAGGLIEGDGATSAAIQGNGNNMDITNSGTITGLNSGTAILFGSGTNTLNVTGGAINGNLVGSGSTSGTFGPGAGQSFTYGGSISNFNSVTITSGTVKFTGASTYSGSTSVTGGKFVMNGSINNSAVTVNAGAILGGTGSSGAVTIKGGGALAPGNSPGIYTTTSAVFQSGSAINAGAQYVVDIVAGGAPVAGTTYDQTVLTGNGAVLSLDKTAGTGSVLVLNISGSLRTSGIASDVNPYNPTGANSSLDNYFIFKLQDPAATIDSTNSRFAIVSDGTNFVTINYDTNQFSTNNPNGIGTFTLDGQEWAISYTADSATNSTVGGNDVAITAIPEPHPGALVLCGFGLLFALRRFGRSRFPFVK